jgi:hypothetical protein
MLGLIYIYIYDWLGNFKGTFLAHMHAWGPWRRTMVLEVLSWSPCI